jgi:bifunctional DNA-binding transcriptional regulator/antitoxin component of YhaV-PrlF toxin-antitoxin module
METLNPLITLQRITTKIGSKEYHKYQVTIPEEHVKKLGWQKKDIIEFNIDQRNSKLTLKKGAPKTRPMHLNYDMFSHTIFWNLLRGPSTYRDLASHAPGLPKKPNPLWVQRLEKEYPAFKRRKDKKTLRMIWSMGG